MGDAARQGAARRQIFLRLPGLAGGRLEDHGPGRAAHLENQQFTPPLLGQHHQEPPVCVRHGEDAKSGRLLVGHRPGVHGLFFSQRDSTGEARANQQAPLRQRHSQVQTGSEGLLQAGPGPAARHGPGVPGLSAAGVQGHVLPRGGGAQRALQVHPALLHRDKKENGGKRSPQ
ncbi:unnamed protein product [Tetraodon nigroviridis]|uniref:(spotted green pufferfish) hypothetical protein n=1 Tax=Tetraodon nigroviridis TaxID=99883 RepID=Q4TE44_TETNG|nr:unnamed protein product [Tetraodon nigroviridis]